MEITLDGLDYSGEPPKREFKGQRGSPAGLEEESHFKFYSYKQKWILLTSSLEEYSELQKRNSVYLWFSFVKPSVEDPPRLCPGSWSMETVR